MDLFEYQAKELFAEYGVPVQPGKVAHTADEAREIAAEFAAEGHPLVVVKAQVKTGGRGKAGGVKLANGPDEAYAKASQILGMDIKGHTVHTVLDRPGGRHRRRVLPVVPAGPGQPHVPVHLHGPGRHGDRGGRAQQPRRPWPGSRSRR